MFGPRAPGRLIDIGGRRLHVRDLGAGSPVVVLEAGAGGWSSHWGALPDMLARHTRVLAYDRAGLGWSDPAPEPRTGEGLAADLVALLDALGIARPVVLVGHSFGAALVRAVAHRSPLRVAGLVFVDGWHESMAEWERSRGLRLEPGPLMRFVHLCLARLGVFRVLTGVLPTPPAPWPLERDAWRAILALSSSHRSVRASLREADLADEIDEANRGAAPIALPVRVLVARKTVSAVDVPRGYPVDDHNAAWVASSRRLAALSADSEVSVVEDCDHMLHLREPAAVSAAVLQLVDDLRAPSVTSSPAHPSGG